MNRYHVVVELETRNGVGLTRSRHEAVSTRLREFWPLATVLASSGNPLFQAKVAAEFEGPVQAMDVLGVVIATLREAGVPVTFRRVTIIARHHGETNAAADIERD